MRGSEVIVVGFAYHSHAFIYHPSFLSLPEAVVHVAAEGWLRQPCDAYYMDSTNPNKGRRGLPPPSGSPPG